MGKPVKTLVLDLMPKHHDTCADMRHIFPDHQIYSIPVKPLFGTKELQTMIELADLTILTGAPLDQKPLSEVTFKNDFLQILEWLDGKPALFSCWSALYAYQTHLGTRVQILEDKLVGTWQLETDSSEPVYTAVSRYARIPYTTDPHVHAGTVETGVSIAQTDTWTYSMDHPEYQPGTLRKQLTRDGHKLPFSGNIITPGLLDAAQQLLRDLVNETV